MYKLRQIKTNKNINTQNTLIPAPQSPTKPIRTQMEEDKDNFFPLKIKNAKFIVKQLY